MNPKSTKNLSFLDNLWFSPNPIATITSSPSIQRVSLSIKVWSLSLVSFFPWILNLRHQTPPQFLPSSQSSLDNRRQGRREDPGRRGGGGRGCAVPLFRPYVAKVPWHGGARAFLSQFFPRYGHYCGPNWSSGKDGGSLLWDRRPIDWLDFCCYCHDIGYDSHDQATLLKADLAFLECLEKPRMSDKGDARIAHLYRTMCITGLRNFLIPYRKHLVNQKEGQTPVQWVKSLSGKANECRET